MRHLERRAAAAQRVSIRGGRLFWEPSAALRRRGYKGQPLGPLSAEALAQADALNVAADLALADKAASGSVAAAIAAYLRQLRVQPATERSYRSHLARLEAAHGTLALPQLSREVLQGWHDGIAETAPREATNAMTTVRTFLSWCIEANRLHAMPGRVKMAPRRRRRRVGTRDEVWALVNAADQLGRPSIGTALILMVSMMQREADVLELTTGHYEAGAFRIVQNKTKAELEVPLHPVALDRLGPLPRGLNAARPIVTSEVTLAAYDTRAFQRAFAKVRAYAARRLPSLEGRDAAVRDPNYKGALQAGDLRRTGMVWAAQGGATVPQIVSLSGHSIERGRTILEHYLPRERALAAQATVRLNMHLTPD